MRINHKNAIYHLPGVQDRCPGKKTKQNKQHLKCNLIMSHNQINHTSNFSAYLLQYEVVLCYLGISAITARYIKRKETVLLLLVDK